MHRSAKPGATLACLLVLVGCGGSTNASTDASVVEVGIEPVSARTSAAPAPSTTAPPPAVAASSASPPLSDEQLLALIDDAAAANSAVANTTSAGLNLRSSGGIGGLSGGGGGLATIGSSGPVGASSAPAPSVPTRVSEVTVTSSVQGAVTGYEQVVAGMRAGFRRCHNKWLMQDPQAVGTVTLRADLDVNGAVTSATVTQPNKRLGDTVPCARARIEAAQFAAPGGSKASVSITIDFAVKP